MVNYWKIAPGRSAWFWKQCVERNCIAINWLNDTNLRDFESYEEIQAAIIQNGEGLGGGASSIWPFVHEVALGDVVIANLGLSKVVGIGTITSDYLPPGHRRNPNKDCIEEGFCQTRLVDWRITEVVSFSRRLFNQPTVQRLTSDKYAAIRNAYWRKSPGLHSVLAELFPPRLPEDAANDEYIPYEPNDQDLRRSVERQIMERRGQRAFRDSLRVKFQDKCVVTGCYVVDVLEAAHINPYRGVKDNHVENGLLLRSDIHTLFDLNLLGVNPHDLTVELHPRVKSEYRSIEGLSLQIPKGVRIAVKALKERYRIFKESLHHES